MKKLRYLFLTIVLFIGAFLTVNAQDPCAPPYWPDYYGGDINLYFFKTGATMYPTYGDNNVILVDNCRSYTVSDSWIIVTDNGDYITVTCESWTPPRPWMSRYGTISVFYDEYLEHTVYVEQTPLLPL